MGGLQQGILQLFPRHLIQVAQVCHSRAGLDPGVQALWMGREESAEPVDALRAGSGTYGDTLIHAFIQQSWIPHGFLFLSSLPVSERQ